MLVVVAGKTGWQPGLAQEQFRPLRSAYMGQQAESEPQIFLPGKISTGFREGSSVFFRQGLSFLWRTDRTGTPALFVLEDRDGRWQPPSVVRFFDDSADVWNFTLAPGGRTLYFTSNRRPSPGGSNLWRIRLGDDGWKNPELLGSEVNSDPDESFPSITSRGDLYFSRRDPRYPADSDLWMAPRGADGFLPAKRIAGPVKICQRRRRKLESSMNLVKMEISGQIISVTFSVDATGRIASPNMLPNGGRCIIGCYRNRKAKSSHPTRHSGVMQRLGLYPECTLKSQLSSRLRLHSGYNLLD